MDSELQHDETVDRDRDEPHRLRSQLVAVRAVLDAGEPDYRARCDTAADALRALLALPTDLPGAWEAGHVSALDDELRDVLGILDGADR